MGGGEGGSGGGGRNRHQYVILARGSNLEMAYKALSRGWLYQHVDGAGSVRRAMGALDGGPPMSHVDFKIWLCRMSLSLIFPHCHMSNVRKGCHMSL